jgi:hypothetical protein
VDTPIACSLSAADYETRAAVIADLASRELRSREPLPAGARLVFAAGEQTERELRDVIAAEARCCPFLQFALHDEGDALRLDVTGPDDAQPIIAELFTPTR